MARRELDAEGIRAEPPPPVIREATPADMDRVRAIEVASFTDPWSRSAFERLLGDYRVHFMVACDAERVVMGYVVAWFVVDEGEIANLAVAPEARGRHVGAALLDHTVRRARARGVGALYLEVRDSNAPARALYASRGFVEVGRRRRYYRRPVEDALVLRLVLPQP
ncbi:MAG TPA: ribosomal protein S18-alanine N-acetyltransferase [Gemmatimonadaceae bacterium]